MKDGRTEEEQKARSGCKARERRGEGGLVVEYALCPFILPFFPSRIP